MVEGADGEWSQLRSSDAEREAEYELKLKELDRKLNEYDLDVKSKVRTGEIDATLRRIITDKHGEMKEVFTESPKSSGKYIWRGLRLLTERPMGSGSLSELRGKFPEWHVTLVRKNIQEDITNEWPDAVEYFFSPRKETIDSMRKKYANKPRKYGKHKRTMQQYQRFLEEGKKLALLDADENVVLDKFTKYFTGKIKEMFTQEALDPKSLSAYRKVKGFEESLKQFTPDIPEEHEAYKGKYKDSENLKAAILSNERLVLEALQIKHNEKMLGWLERKSTINSLIVYFRGGESIDRLLKRYYNWVRESLQYDVAGLIVEAKKDPTWADAEEMNRMADAIKQRSEKQERHSQLNESQIRRPRSISPQRWQRMTPAQRHNSQFRKSLEWFSQLIGVKE